MKASTAIVLLCCSASANARTEEWTLLSADRSYRWHVVEARGSLEHSGDRYSGTLSVDDQPWFKVSLQVQGAEAVGTVEVIGGDAGADLLKGTYRRVEEPGPNNCWETIQLYDGLNYKALLRNTTCR